MEIEDSHIIEEIKNTWET
ncbi:hypothetical protein Goarm_009391, partial [Gossypium armourianum]|nr:hypothetical protein [Gossypium armourianum]